MKNTYYYVLLDLYKASFKQAGLKKNLGEDFKYFIICFILLIGGMILITTGGFLQNKNYFVSGLLMFISTGTLFYIKFIKDYSSLSFRESRCQKIEKFNKFLEEYNFCSEEVELMISKIETSIKENRVKKERRNDVLFKWYVALSIGIVAFFGKEFWSILDLKSYVESNVSKEKVFQWVPIVGGAIVTVIFFLIIIGLMLMSFYNDLVINKRTKEVDVCLALEEVLSYRRGVQLHRIVLETEGGKRILLEELESNSI